MEVSKICKLSIISISCGRQKTCRGCKNYNNQIDRKYKLQKLQNK